MFLPHFQVILQGYA